MGQLEDAANPPRRARPAVNVGGERFCLRWAPVGGRDPSDYRCSQCNARVVYEPRVGEGSVTLICVDCLVKDAPGVDLDVHPGDPMHCSECMDRAQAAGWQGTSDVRLHSNWYGA
jgi:hypothetical protein